MRPCPALAAALLLALPGALRGQAVSTRAVHAAGGSGTGQGASLDWAVGQPASGGYGGGASVLTAGVLQPEGAELNLHIGLLLGGPFDGGSGLMHDSLRAQGLLPVQEPYTALAHAPVGLQGGAAMEPTATAAQGPDAVVDWVFVELRDALDNTRIVAARSALVQRDGDVVDMDGASPLRITALPGNYHLGVRHRNHLPMLTLQPLAFGAGMNVIDLRTGSIAGHVPDAQAVVAGSYVLWPGDVSGNEEVKYVGADNDRDPILLGVGGSVPTNTATGYLPTDVNMDGVVKYVGANNDRDPILVVIGGSVPTAVRTQTTP